MGQESLRVYQAGPRCGSVATRLAGGGVLEIAAAGKPGYYRTGRMLIESTPIAIDLAHMVAPDEDPVDEQHKAFDDQREQQRANQSPADDLRRQQHLPGVAVPGFAADVRVSRRQHVVRTHVPWTLQGQ